MAKSSEIKLASDIIRRVLDAAERGDVDFLNYMKLVSRRRSGDVKSGGQSKQEHLDLPRAGGRISQEYLLNEIGRFDTETNLDGFLKEKYPTRTEIVAVARALHVPAPKTDDYEALVERVIAATLGYKMRSQAVRGPQATRGRREAGST